jgi:hypothetical protein
LPLAVFNEKVENGELSKDSGYKYKNVVGQTHVELHVDYHPEFQDACSHLPYSGHLSVHKKSTDKPLTIVGQDECIFK